MELKQPGEGRGPVPHNTGGRRVKRGWLVGLVVVMLVGLVSLAQAGEEKKGVTVGALTCNEASGWGLVFGSSKSLKCVFNPAEKGGQAVRFTGTIKKYGVDLG
jgi:hypothetical protein